jgi:NHLM bacteriocin system ABC transporter ATP-binding protein
MADNPQSASSSDPAHAWELFLLGLRYRDSRLVTLSGNEPFLLAGADQAWLVYKGTVDVFAAQLEDGEPAGARYHLFRAETRQLLLGMDLNASPVGLLASPAPQTEILSFSRSRLALDPDKPEHTPIIAALIDGWIGDLAASIARDVRPKDLIRIESGAQQIALEPGQMARALRGVWWVQHRSGGSRLVGRDDLPALGGEPLIPLADTHWLQASEEGAALRVFDTAAALAQDPDWMHLNRYHALILTAVDLDIRREKATASRLLREKIANDEFRVRTAFARLASTWSDEYLPGLVGIDSPDPLVAACGLIGHALGVTIKTPPDYGDAAAYQNPLAEIARASRLRLRMVLLRDDWWRRDNGPLLAYRGEEHHPVALLPIGMRRYALRDPARQEILPVDERIAAELQGIAHMFYRPFPDRPLGAWGLLRFGLRGARRDALMVLAVGIVGGMLGLLVPIVTGVIFDRLIPSGAQGQLVTLGSVLAASAVAVALFQVARSVALLHIEGRMDSAIQAAVWDRLLSLPADFFRRYSPGDLAERALGITRIRQILSGAVALAALAGLFSWLNLALMFYYDATLALTTLGLVIVASVVTLALGLRLLRFDREVARKQGEISGLIAQLIGGIAKLRVASAESRAFYLWASEFSEQKKLAFQARATDNALTTFVAAFPIASAMAIYALAGRRAGLSTGAFLAFYAAFATFMSAGLQSAAALVTGLSVVPMYERLRPILRALPEVDEQKTHPGELSGGIEVSHVSFRYDKGGPLALDDVTFNARAGEFVAVVGPSGSGKSTLLRHLLGFETPDSGAIYYDGQALAEVDLRAVRRQIGVVLQHSQVMTGSILDNILGASNLSADAAWEAARRAGIAADIEQMPMGMQTFISEGGSSFSGGQRQRLLIARALVTRPRIIFFDEATSALDDQSQAIVIESVKGVDATRIVIAHRLSTVVDADRILVLRRGRLVESGTYQELMDRKGVFADLAQRQLL